MKACIVAGVLSAVMVFAIPALLLAEPGKTQTVEMAPEAAEPVEAPEAQPLFDLLAPEAVPVSAEEMAGFDESVQVTLLVDGEERQLTLAEYLTGVVAGELTGAFPDEALKAQAAASRTYALRQLTAGRHDGAICANPACCQAWTDPAGKAETAAGAELVERAAEAVAATDGMVLTWEGRLIEAVYFSCSGGRTEAAADVWGGDVPYLQAVDSPGEEDAPRYCADVTFPTAALRELLEGEGAALGEDPGRWVQSVRLTRGGGVAEMTLGGKTFTGGQLRTLLGLNSARFSFLAGDDTVTLRTLGFGHRVGLSQYGAAAMARAGSDWQQIVSHYYTGVTLTRLEPGEGWQT